MRTYIYPQNLKASANIWLWTLKDFSILSISLLISVVLWSNTAIYFPLVLVLIFAFMTIRYDEATVMDFIRWGVKFFITTQQEFQWTIDS